MRWFSVLFIFVQIECRPDDVSRGRSILRPRLMHALSLSRENITLLELDLEWVAQTNSIDW